MENVFSARCLTKSYGRSKILTDLNITIPKGSIYGLVGRNGAGKTTLIRLICGLQLPDSGELELYGQTGKDLTRARRRVGAVVESPAFYGDMSAADNLKHQFLVLGLPDHDRVPELLKLVGLENTGKKKARTFSLGMKQRLGIAMALAGDPDFLILDEPANGLDPEGIVEIRELILKLNRENGVTVLVSSHILDELARIATHYGFLEGGRLIREIDAKSLESSLRRRLHVTVTDTAKMAAALDGLGLAYTVLSEREADVYGDVSVTDLTLTLRAAGCDLLTVSEKNETLESYYIDLLGGERHD